jgi:Flp pilus assembly pilin Flp
MVPEITNVTQILIRAGRFLRSNDGQDLIEYGLLMALIAIVAMGAVGTVGSTIYDVFWRAIAQNV